MNILEATYRQHVNLVQGKNADFEGRQSGFTQEPKYGLAQGLNSMGWRGRPLIERRSGSMSAEWVVPGVGPRFGLVESPPLASNVG